MRTCDIFLRVNNRKRYLYARDFEKAGYPYADLTTTGVWSEVHAWCLEQFPYGKRKHRGYTWCGARFFFLREADRDAFVARWCKEPPTHKESIILRTIFPKRNEAIPARKRR